MLDSARTARRTHPVRDRWRNWLAAWAVFLAGLSLTFAAWRFLAGSELERDRNVFHHRVRELAGRLTKRIEADAQILRGAAGLFQSVREVTRDEWRRYVDSLQLAEAYPGIQGVGFSEWIAPEGLAAHELRIRAQGFPSYAVKPPGVRERYTSIVYLEPFTALNQRAFGFDMYSEPVRRAAMDRAIDTQSITVSDAIVLLQENPGTTQAGIIMYQPIYHWDQPTGTVAERRAAIVGFVYLPIRMGNLTRGALGTLPTDLSFDLYSAPGPASSALLFSTLGQDEPVATDTFAEPLEVFGSRWMLAARELSSDAHDPDQAGGEATALFGVLLSAALAALTVAVTRRREQTRALAASRRASEARFRSYFDLPLVGAALTSPTKGWLAVNERLCELLGYRRAELTDKTWAQLTHLDDLAADVALFERVQAGLQDSYTLEKRLLRKDGSSVWTHVAVQAVRDAEGQIEYFAALIEDRGRQKRQEQILEARVNLMDHAQTHGLHDILVRTLDLVEDLTDSCVGFYHFVQPDGRTLTLQAWSTRTARDYCRAEGHGRHYDVDEAGVWVDCIRQGHAVIHNDYEALPHKRGLPPGHAPLVRELAVPVHRAGRIVAVLGVGNKSMGYTEDDVATVTAFADLAWDIAERVLGHERIRESEARFTTIFEHAPVMMALSRLEDGAYMAVNECFVTASGFTPEAALGRSAVELGWMSPEVYADVDRQIQAHGRVDAQELALRAENGTPVVASFSATVVNLGGVRRLLSIALDVTAERTLRGQLQQSQKLESVGRLAGGVAHDFNNMLAVIRGYTELLLETTAPDEPVRADLEEIGRAAERAADVTRQLLAFARRQVIEPRVLNLNETVIGTLKMLRRLIGEDIELDWRPGAALARVQVDPSQIDQVLANLCVNARDAIDGIGRITIETADVVLDGNQSHGFEGLAAGRFVRLSVTDTGPGIAANVIAHIFEPFFTTKAPGRGTGLGLATVYGIARQNAGMVDVLSPPGHGATFRVFLPAVEGAVEVEGPLASPSPRAPEGAAQTILVVEDEPAVLRICTSVLAHLGYIVLSAGNAADALRLAVAHAAEIRLLISDMVMPDMCGPDLAAEILLHIPGLPCLFMSGYTPETMERKGLGTRVAFIQKPFEVQALANRVREALG